MQLIHRNDEEEGGPDVMSYVNSVLLTDGETASLGAVKIASIPHISIIEDKRDGLKEVIQRYKDETSRVLGEV